MDGCWYLVVLIFNNLQVLGDDSLDELHDRVINSLRQFTYDRDSLNVLMGEGLIPRLVRFLEKHLAEKKVG